MATEIMTGDVFYATPNKTGMSCYKWAVMVRHPDHELPRGRSVSPFMFLNKKENAEKIAAALNDDEQPEAPTV